jgi:hypothetical protein
MKIGINYSKIMMLNQCSYFHVLCSEYMKQVCRPKADNRIEWIFKGSKTSCKYKQGIHVSSRTNKCQVMKIYEAVIILQDFNFEH